MTTTEQIVEEALVSCEIVTPVPMVIWTPGKTIETLQAEAIRAALTYYNGNKSLTARDLGISVRKIRIWVATYPELAHFRLPPSRACRCGE